MVQDESTSVVWGMPGAVAQAGLAHKILPLPELAVEINRRIRRGAQRILPSIQSPSSPRSVLAKT